MSTEFFIDLIVYYSRWHIHQSHSEKCMQIGQKWQIERLCGLVKLSQNYLKEH